MLFILVDDCNLLRDNFKVFNDLWLLKLCQYMCVCEGVGGMHITMLRYKPLTFTGLDVNAFAYYIDFTCIVSLLVSLFYSCGAAVKMGGERSENRRDLLKTRKAKIPPLSITKPHGPLTADQLRVRKAKTRHKCEHCGRIIKGDVAFKSKTLS